MAIRKSAVLPLLVFISLTAAGVGFYSAQKLNGRQIENLSPSETSPARQHNYLIIEVDSLLTPSSALTSLWFVSVFESENQTALVFKKLSSLDMINGNNNLNSQEEGKLVSKLTRLLKDTSIIWDGYLLVDHAGVQQLIDWVSLNTTAELKPTSDALEKVMQYVCSKLIRPDITLQPDLPEFDWEQFDPSFSTNIRLEALLSDWSSLTHSGRPLHCEFFTD